jgi:hypothetical protein
MNRNEGLDPAICRFRLLLAVSLHKELLELLFQLEEGHVLIYRQCELYGFCVFLKAEWQVLEGQDDVLLGRDRQAQNVEWVER